MTTERLTEMTLEQHDTRQQLAKDRIASKTNEEPGSIRGRPRLLSRSESKKSLAAGSHDSSFLLDRQNSKSSTGSLNPRPGMSVFRVVQAARAWKRLSQRNQTIIEKPKVILENTYRLGPDAEQMFKPDKVQRSINEVLVLFLRNFKYSHDGSKRMCLNLSSEIKSRVKQMVFSRYKIVSHVVIIQNRGQGSDISSRCVWTPQTDSFASCTIKTDQVICVANVYAVYYE